MEFSPGLAVAGLCPQVTAQTPSTPHQQHTPSPATSLACPPRAPCASILTNHWWVPGKGVRPSAWSPLSPLFMCFVCTAKSCWVWRLVCHLPGAFSTTSVSTTYLFTVPHRPPHQKTKNPAGPHLLESCRRSSFYCSTLVLHSH